MSKATRLKSNAAMRRPVLSTKGVEASERIDLVAVHEASHAIAMWRLGFGVEQCSIVERSGDLGATIPIRAVDDLSGSEEGTRRAAIPRQDKSRGSRPTPGPRVVKQLFPGWPHNRTLDS